LQRPFWLYTNLQPSPLFERRLCPFACLLPYFFIAGTFLPSMRLDPKKNMLKSLNLIRGLKIPLFRSLHSRGSDHLLTIFSKAVFRIRIQSGQRSVSRSRRAKMTHKKLGNFFSYIEVLDVFF
jgi:hypothetical protein